MANPWIAGTDIAKQLTKILGMIWAVVTVDPASLGTGATAITSVAVTGLQPGHRVLAMIQGAPSAGGAVLAGANCTTPGQVALSYSNPSAGSIDLASHSVLICAIPDFNS
jgi:hypothetical protein